MPLPCLLSDFGSKTGVFTKSSLIANLTWTGLESMLVVNVILGILVMLLTHLHMKE